MFTASQEMMDQTKFKEDNNVSIALSMGGCETQDSPNSNVTQESRAKKQAATWNVLTLYPS